MKYNMCSIEKEGEEEEESGEISWPSVNSQKDMTPTKSSFKKSRLLRALDALPFFSFLCCMDTQDALRMRY